MLYIPSICSQPAYGAEFMYTSQATQFEAKQNLFKRISKIFKKNYIASEAEDSSNCENKANKGKDKPSTPSR